MNADPCPSTSHHGWTVTEQTCESKHGPGTHPDICEDVVVETPTLIAVIDGATDKSGARFTTPSNTPATRTGPAHDTAQGASITSGRLAALTIAAALTQAATWPTHQRTPRAIIDHATTRLRAAVAAQHPQLLNSSTRPCASMAVLDTEQHLLWRVGDCAWATLTPAPESPQPTVTVSAPVKLIDIAATQLRVAVETSPGGTGRGRDAIAPILLNQGLLANTPGPAGYGTIDGTPVLDHHIDTHHLPHDTLTVVLASDGYTQPDDLIATGIRHGLPAAETLLASAVADDPNCLTILAGTKPVPDGGTSYDDRTWIRLDRTHPTPGPS